VSRGSGSVDFLFAGFAQWIGKVAGAGVEGRSKMVSAMFRLSYVWRGLSVSRIVAHSSAVASLRRR